MCKVGDKFIIEIGGEYPENPFENGENGKAPTILYKIKGFNSLVFDEKGLDRLEKAENLERLAYDRGYSKAENDYFKQTEVDAENTMQAGYEKGLSDAWECMKKILDMTVSEQREVFGILEFSADDILGKLTPQEAIEKLKAWEEKQEIKVGDVVRVDSLVGDLVVTWCKEGKADCMSLSTGAFCIIDCEKLVKTGKHIDLTEIFKGSEGEDV